MKKYIFLGLILLVPALALAAPTLTFNPVPPETFNVEEDGKYLVTVDLTEYAEDTSVEFSIAGPEGHDDATKEVLETYEFITNEQHEFGWDGVLGTLEGEPGVYEISISGEDLYGDATNELVHTVSIIESVPDPDPEEPDAEEQGDGDGDAEEEEELLDSEDTDPEDNVDTEGAGGQAEAEPVPAPQGDGDGDGDSDADEAFIKIDDIKGEANDKSATGDGGEDGDDADNSEEDDQALFWWIVGGLIVALLVGISSYKRTKGETTLGDITVTKDMDK